MSALNLAQIITETITKIAALNLGGVGIAEVYAGRFVKTQKKRISANVFLGDFAKGPSGTGTQFIEVPVHIHLSVMKTDTIKGAVLAADLASYVEQIDRALHLLRPQDLSAPIDYFFLTQSSIDDIDSETGQGQSLNVGVDQSAEAYLTVRFQFYRPLG